MGSFASRLRLRTTDRTQEVTMSVDKLAAAGLLDPKKLTKEHREAINKLTPQEVDALVSAKQKLGGKNSGVTLHQGADFF
jgi:hypothetical protein